MAFTKSVLVLCALILPFNAGWAASAASATANATATVIASIGISKTQDLQFGQAVQGDASVAVPPTDTTKSAGFLVTGEASMAYSITLPTDGTVTMLTGTGGNPDNQIAVTNFKSNPATSGKLGVNGSQEIYVGATRAAIRSTQTKGLYTGAFTVTVAYQ